MNANPQGGCRDCDQLTGGRCWRHATAVYIAPPAVIVPQVVRPPRVVVDPPSPFEIELTASSDS